MAETTNTRKINRTKTKHFTSNLKQKDTRFKYSLVKPVSKGVVDLLLIAVNRIYILIFCFNC